MNQKLHLNSDNQNYKVENVIHKRGNEAEKEKKNKLK